MTKQVQFRRGTTAQHTTFTGALAEVTVDTDLDVVVVHDGSTVGGQQMVGRTATQTLTNKTLTSPTVTGGSINNTPIGATTRNTGAFTTLNADGNVTLGDASADTVTVNGTTTFNAPVSFSGGTSHLTLTGELRGPATFILDPAAVGDDTGTVEIKGNLTVQGTTTTINSTTSVIADPVIELRKGTSITAADGGIQVNLTTGPGGAVTGYQRIQWNNSSTRWETTDGTTAKAIVNTVDSQTIDGSKSFVNNLTASGANATIQFSPTGTGSVTINPATAGSIDRMSIGATTAASGRFTTLAAKDASAAFDVTFSPASSTALTANRTLTFDVINAARTIKLAGNIDLANNLTTSGNFALTLTTTAATSVTLPTSGTLLTTTGSGSSLTFGTGSLSLAGNLTTSGAFATTLTVTAATNVTLPTTGTLVNTAVTTLSSLASIGTITTGTWNGSVIGATYGGTGVNNGSNTITLGGNLTTSGAFALTLTTSGATNVTLPTSGTLATLTNTTFVGTTSIALNRASAELALTGITGFSTVAATGANSTGISIITGATTTSGNSGDVNIDVGAAATTLGVVNIATTNANIVNVGSTSKNTTLNVRGNGTAGTAILGTNVTTGIVNLFTGVTGTINIGTTGTAVVVPEPATASSAAPKSYVDAMAIAMGL